MKFICLGPQYAKPFVVVVDYNFYHDNAKEIIDWKNQITPGWKIIGMVLEFKNEQDRLAFLLRWS